MAGRKKSSGSTRERLLCLGYVRVSTTKQVDEGASLEAQRATLTAEAERRGWDLELVADEGVSGKAGSVAKRPQLQDAMRRLAAGEADVLLATRLDRVSRSVVDFGSILARAKAESWNVVLLDPGVDLSTDTGKFVAQVLAAAAEYERDLIARRTTEGMAQRRAEGVLFGRPRTTPADVRDRVVELTRAAGRRWSEVARTLNAEGVPTARGGTMWRASSVRHVALTAVTLRITEPVPASPAATEATAAVLAAADPYKLPTPDRLALGPGVHQVQVPAVDWPDVAPLVERLNDQAPAGWYCAVLDGRPSGHFADFAPVPVV